MFGAGIDRFVQEQEQQRNAAMEALGKGKKFIGKTAGGVVGGISTAGAISVVCCVELYDLLAHIMDRGWFPACWFSIMQVAWNASAWWVCEPHNC